MRGPVLSRKLSRAPSSPRRSRDATLKALPELGGGMPVAAGGTPQSATSTDRTLASASIAAHRGGETAGLCAVAFR